MPLYVAARTKLEKTQVIASVVDKVRRESPGGGFVKRDFHTGLWFEIGDDKARDKVCLILLYLVVSNPAVLKLFESYPLTLQLPTRSVTPLGGRSKKWGRRRKVPNPNRP